MSALLKVAGLAGAILSALAPGAAVADTAEAAAQTSTSVSCPPPSESVGPTTPAPAGWSLGSSPFAPSPWRLYKTLAGDTNAHQAFLTCYYILIDGAQPAEVGLAQAPDAVYDFARVMDDTTCQATGDLTPGGRQFTCSRGNGAVNHAP